MGFARVLNKRSAAATRLSRPLPLRQAATAVLRLAHLSLVLACNMPFASGCIVADPPEYRDPVQTKPVIDGFRANPTTSSVLVVNTNDQVPFAVPVRSEDAGEELSAHFFVDYGAGSPGLPQNTQTVAASTYADTSREVTWTWKVPLLSANCHLLSLVVAHRTSFEPSDNDVLDPDKADKDAAIINWWLNVNVPTASAATLVNCPLLGIPALGVPTK